MIDRANAGKLKHATLVVVCDGECHVVMENQFLPITTTLGNRQRYKSNKLAVRAIRRQNKCVPITIKENLDG